MLHHTQIISFASINMFLLVNTRVKMNHIDSTRPAPLSVNELTTEYWISYTIWIYKYFIIEILGIKLKQLYEQNVINRILL